MALLWIMPPLIAKRNVMPKFQKTSKISYRKEVDRVDSPHSCTSPGCILYATSRDGVIDIKRWKRDTGIQHRHEKKEDITGFIPQNMEQYINIKVCYCKIYIADTYI